MCVLQKKLKKEEDWCIIFMLHVFKYYFKFQVSISISATLQHDSSTKYIYIGYSNILFKMCVSCTIILFCFEVGE